jgi:hypothetical protein
VKKLFNLVIFYLLLPGAGNFPGLFSSPTTTTHQPVSNVTFIALDGALPIEVTTAHFFTSLHSSTLSTSTFFPLF